MKRFSKYFNEWLYGKDGYYTNYKQIGKEGDFFTSVSTSSFFGGAIAKQIVTSIENKTLNSNTTIVEIGAHHGYLLADVIQFIYTLKPELLQTLNFVIVERYKQLQIQQERYLKESFADAINLSFCDDISDLKLNHAFIFANEIFDAFECDLVYTDKNSILQNAYVKDHKIEFRECEDKRLINHCKKYKITKGEVALQYEDFVEYLCENIKKFEFITFDYGDRYPRNDFSTRVYKNHEVFAIFEESLELKKFYKQSDITYDVHFNHLKDLFSKQNIKSVKFDTQMNSLIDFGILELLELLKANVDENIYLKEAQKVKMLLEPTGMGDRFKTLHIFK
ncbi:MAG: SAM-dependent methyltransferase [Campylobacterota bacterium]